MIKHDKCHVKKLHISYKKGDTCEMNMCRLFYILFIEKSEIKYSEREVQK